MNSARDVSMATSKTDIRTIISQLHSRSVSTLSRHEDDCCAIAAAWFDTSASAHASTSPGPPVWLRQRWNWGPCQWPHYWCEVMRNETADCGVLAALAHRCFALSGRRGVRVQLLEQFDQSAASHWSAMWSEVPGVEPWIFGEVVYHEAAGVLADDGGLRIWDPTDSCWVEARSETGRGAIVALRVVSDEESEPDCQWKQRRLRGNVWICWGLPSPQLD